MLEALINGERDPEVLAGLARGTLRSKIPELVDALTGRFKDHHAFMARLHPDQIDARSRIIDALTGRIEEAMTPFRAAREFLASIPGVSLKVADVFIAETGADMSRFETPGPAPVLGRPRHPPGPGQSLNNAIRQLNSLGFDVTITPATAARQALLSY